MIDYELLYRCVIAVDILLCAGIIVCNLVLICSILSSKAARTRTRNAMLVSMCLGDLMVGALTHPIYIHSYHTGTLYHSCEMHIAIQLIGDYSQDFVCFWTLVTLGMVYVWRMTREKLGWGSPLTGHYGRLSPHRSQCSTVLRVAKKALLVGWPWIGTLVIPIPILMANVQQSTRDRLWEETFCPLYTPFPSRMVLLVVVFYLPLALILILALAIGLLIYWDVVSARALRPADGGSEVPSAGPDSADPAADPDAAAAAADSGVSALPSQNGGSPEALCCGARDGGEEEPGFGGEEEPGFGGGRGPGGGGKAKGRAGDVDGDSVPLSDLAHPDTESSDLIPSSSDGRSSPAPGEDALTPPAAASARSRQWGSPPTYSEVVLNTQGIDPSVVLIGSGRGEGRRRGRADGEEDEAGGVAAGENEEAAGRPRRGGEAGGTTRRRERGGGGGGARGRRSAGSQEAEAEPEPLEKPARMLVPFVLTLQCVLPLTVGWWFFERLQHRDVLVVVSISLHRLYLLRAAILPVAWFALPDLRHAAGALWDRINGGVVRAGGGGGVGRVFGASSSSSSRGEMRGEFSVVYTTLRETPDVPTHAANAATAGAGGQGQGQGQGTPLRQNPFNTNVKV